MRILFVHPNYRSGGAEIAGTWPPAWVAYLTGPLRRAGFDDITFIDAMTEGLSDDQLRQRMTVLQPDVVGTTAITPSIYAAERVLEIAALHVPQAVRVLGGIHATFMYAQVLAEAPHIDLIVRGEGEEIAVALFTAIQEGWTRSTSPRKRERARQITSSPTASRAPPAGCCAACPRALPRLC